MDHCCSSALTLTLVLILATSLQTKAQLEVGFGEVDYRIVESNGGRNIVVQKFGQNDADLVLTITSMRLDEIDPSISTRNVTLDPAEYEDEDEGRKDFEKVVTTVTVPSSAGRIYSQKIFVPIFDDDINEAAEAFYMMIRVDEAKSDPKDIAGLRYLFDGLTRIDIIDDDEISLSFEYNTYEVAESVGIQTELVQILKQDERITEQTLNIVVMVFELSADNAATKEKDFDAGTSTLRFEINPDEQRISVPFEVKDDDIPENQERFEFFLSVSRGNQWGLGTHGNALILIDDNDEAVVGFEFQDYTINEEEQSVEVCIMILSPEVIEITIVGILSTNDETAQAGSDYDPIVNASVVLDNELRSQCFQILIFVDSETETSETFTLHITSDELFTPPNVRFEPNMARVSIRDDPSQTDPCACDENAVCNNENPELEGTCECKEGYRGDGKTCDDIDECQEESDNCNKNAECVNVPGSYQCYCKEGFNGNGFICGDINECRRRSDNCDENALCINNMGSYECMCKEGFIGDGTNCDPPNDDPVDDEDEDEYECINEEDEDTTKTTRRTTKTRTKTKTSTTGSGSGQDNDDKTGTRKTTRKSGTKKNKTKLRRCNETEPEYTRTRSGTNRTRSGTSRDRSDSTRTSSRTGTNRTRSGTSRDRSDSTMTSSRTGTNRTRSGTSRDRSDSTRTSSRTGTNRTRSGTSRDRSDSTMTSSRTGTNRTRSGTSRDRSDSTMTSSRTGTNRTRSGTSRDRSDSTMTSSRTGTNRTRSGTSRDRSDSTRTSSRTGTNRTRSGTSRDRSDSTRTSSRTGTNDTSPEAPLAQDDSTGTRRRPGTPHAQDDSTSTRRGPGTRRAQNNSAGTRGRSRTPRSATGQSSNG